LKDIKTDITARQKEPSEADYFQVISHEGWVATPENGYVTGSIYRVGAQMLMDIKVKHGIDAFYEVIANSGTLIDRWQGTSRCPKE